MSDTDDITAAQLVAACTHLQALDKLIEREVRSLPPAQQIALAKARAFLVEIGWRAVPNVEPWVDRECVCKPLFDATGAPCGKLIDPACKLHPSCTCGTQLADGTNATRRSPCALHPVTAP